MTAGIEALGDSALLIHLGERIDARLNADALAIAAALQSAKLAGVLDIAPAYASVCVRYDPTVWNSGGIAPFDAIAARVGSVVENVASRPASHDDAGAIEVPVVYGGDAGPDLDDVAAHAGLSTHEFIALHSGTDYRVAMLGFAPGFAYLLGLDARLHMARRATPRTRVPAGSIAIGGAQTGIYPRTSPGGWQIIGHTALSLFDPCRDPPALLAPGMRVRFVAQ